MQKKVGFSRTGSVQADRLIVNNGLTASTTYNFYGLTAISFNLPVVDGTNGQALKTDGAGNLSFGPVASSSTSGTSGQSGTSGSSGVNGTSGSSGQSGSSGTSGTRGTSGTSGINGVAGTSGTSGTRGTSGTSGVTGTSGTSGVTGTSGTSGLTGTSGTSGINGTSGTSGQSGSSGTSGLTGTSGTSGANGVGGATILGTVNYIPKFTGATALGNSAVYETNSQLLIPDGTIGTPSIAFASSNTLGFYKTAGLNEIYVALSGANMAFFGQNTSRFRDGSAAVPGIAFLNDGDTGMYRSGANTVDFAAGGERTFFVNNNNINIVATASENSLQFRTRNDGLVDYGLQNGTSGLIFNRYNTSGAFVDTAVIIGKPEGDGGVLFRDGSAATPSISFQNDANTGFYRVTSERVGIVSGGSVVATFPSNETDLFQTRSHFTASNSVFYHVAMATTGGVGVWKLGYSEGTGDFFLDKWVSGSFAERPLRISRALTGYSQVQFTDGYAATPSIAFQNDTDTGFYRAGINTMRAVAGGVDVVSIVPQAFATYQQNLTIDGSSATPSYSFINDVDTGLYRVTTNQLAITAGGATATIFTSTGIQIPDGTNALPSISFANDTDTGIYRSAANTMLLVTNGAARMTVGAGPVSFAATTVVSFGTGSISNPQITFLNDADTGLYTPVANQIAVTTGGANSAVFGATNSMSVRTYFEKAVNHYPVVNASVSGTYSVDMSASNVFNLTLTGNTTLDYTNSSEGSYIILVTQDGVGGRSLNFASGAKFIGATAVSIGTASNAKSIIQLIHIGTQSVVTSQRNLTAL